MVEIPDDRCHLLELVPHAYAFIGRESCACDGLGWDQYFLRPEPGQGKRGKGAKILLFFPWRRGLGLGQVAEFLLKCPSEMSSNPTPTFLPGPYLLHLPQLIYFFPLGYFKEKKDLCQSPEIRTKSLNACHGNFYGEFNEHQLLYIRVAARRI